MTRPYYFSAILVAPGGDALPGVTWQPFANRYPTTCWQPSPGDRGEVVDQIELPLGNNHETGNWWLSVSAFAIQHDETMPPLVVSLPEGAALPDAQVILGQVTLAP